MAVSGGDNDDASKQDLFHLIKRFGAFVTFKIGHLFSLVFLSLSLSTFFQLLIILLDLIHDIKLLLLLFFVIYDWFYFHCFV